MPTIPLPTNHVTVSYGPGGDIVQNIDRSGTVQEYQRPNIFGSGSLTVATSKKDASKIIAYANLLRVVGYETIIPIGPQQVPIDSTDISASVTASNGLQNITLPAGAEVSIGNFLYIGSSVVCVVRAINPLSPFVYPAVERADRLQMQRPTFPYIVARPIQRNSLQYGYNREGAVSLNFAWIQTSSDPRILQAYF